MAREGGRPDDFLPRLSPRAIGFWAGVSAWAAIGLLVQGVGTVFWVLLRVASGNKDPLSALPTWLYVAIAVLLHLGVLAAAIQVGRRTARSVAERRSGSNREK